MNKTAGRGTHPVCTKFSSLEPLRSGLPPAGQYGGRVLFPGQGGAHVVNVRSDLIAHNGKSDTPYLQRWI